MRLLPLLGLAGLATASPVIGREAGADASVAPAPRLVVYTEDRSKGYPYEIAANNRCVKFDWPVYKNLSSTWVANQICYFMDSDACTGKLLITADGLGGRSWASLDAGGDSNVSSRIASVYCKDHRQSQIGGANVAQAVFQRDGPGETTVCRSTMNIGPCVTLSANDACVYFGSDLRHNIRNVYQAYGSKCNYYYDDNCYADPPVMTVDTHQQALHVTLDKQTGDRLAYVKCKDHWSKEDTQDDPIHIYPRADNAVSMRQGDIQACRLSYCHGLSALNSCQAFSDLLAKGLTKITQAAGTTCVYWKNANCSSEVVTSAAVSFERQVNLGPRESYGREIAAVSCHAASPSELLHVGTEEHRDIDWATNVVQTRSTTETPCDDPRDTIVYNSTSTVPSEQEEEATSLVSRTEHTSHKNIDVTYCSGEDFTGSCLHLSADTCWSIPPNSIQSWRQSENLVCRFSSDGGCKNILWYVATDFTYKAENVPSGIADLIVTISCESAGDQSASEANTDMLAPAAKRGTDTSLNPVSATICMGPNLTGSCIDINANMCWVMLPKSAHSYRQSERLFCKYYSDKDCTETIWSVTTGSTYQVGNLPSGVTEHTQTIMCIPYNDAAHQSTLNLRPPPMKRGAGPATADIQIRVCSGTEFMGYCHDLSPETCWLLEGQEKNSARSWHQGNHLVCMFYSGPGCSGLLWRVRSTDGPVDLNIVPALTADATVAVRCDPYHGASQEPASELRPSPMKREEGSAGQVLVADQLGFAGKTQLVDTVKDDNNCAPLFNQFFWNLQSLIQYKGSVCTYWQYNCGDLLPDNKPVFTVDSLGGQIGLSPIPYVFGGENRNKIAYIRCSNGASGAAYLTGLDPSIKVIDINTPGIAKDTASSAGPQDGQLSSRTESTTDDYYEPLTLYHDINKGGAIMTYVGPSCGLNPFNVDPIKSLYQEKGFRCSFYPAWGCQETNGKPLYIDTPDRTAYFANVDFPILSMSCTRLTQLIENKGEGTPRVLAPAKITAATISQVTLAARRVRL